ncbi:MAG: DUF6544 family protein [Bacillota bacterium]|nr:DUF6544 family protein [Bacillota bacterium]
MKYFVWFLVLSVGVFFLSSLTAQYFSAKTAKEEVRTELFEDFRVDSETMVTAEDIGHLPVCVQKWLGTSGAVGQVYIQTVRLKQRGSMRTDPEKKWMPFKAEQYFNFRNPGFIWYARIDAAPLMHITGRDKYYDGKGNMLIKVISLFTAANASGKEMDQGSLVRYLSEMIWSPSAVLNEYVQWEGIDDLSARATMTYGGVTASGIFMFNQQGDVVSFSAQRYRDLGGSYSLDDWYISLYNYAEFHGIRIPAKAEVIWKLPEGDFKWLQLEVTEVEHNATDVY